MKYGLILIVAFMVFMLVLGFTLSTLLQQPVNNELNTPIDLSRIK